MRDLQRDIGRQDAPGPRGAPDRGAPRTTRAARSAAFLVAYACYLVAVVGLGQRLVLRPMITLLGPRRQTLVGGWLRFHARATLALARVLAGVRVRVQGAIGPESCIVVMTHQSLLDIPIGLSLVKGPYPLIPTRDRYRRGIPGVSPLARLARFPFVSQGRALTRAELRAMVDAADQVARGEQSLLIFPEGHRSRDGAIAPFMRSGLRLVLRRARRPVYCVVADGGTRSRAVADALTGIAGTRVSVVVLGPFAPPETSGIEAFIDSLYARMSDTLAAMRAAPHDDGPAPIAGRGRPDPHAASTPEGPAPAGDTQARDANDAIGAR